MNVFVERRRAQRRPVLETFSLFAVVPSKGVHRLQIQDLSELGIGFFVDIEGESPENFPISPDDALDVRFYLNQSLFLPLKVRVIRVVNKEGVRHVGAEFSDKTSKTYKAFLSFMAMLDAIVEAVCLDPDPIHPEQV